MGKESNAPARRMRTKGPIPTCVKPQPVQVNLESGMSSRDSVKVKLEPGISSGDAGTLKQEHIAMKLEPGVPPLQTWRTGRRIWKKVSQVKLEEPFKRGRLLLDLMAKSAARLRATPMQQNHHRVAALAERATLVEAGNKYMEGWLGCATATVGSKRKHHGGRPSRFALYWETEMARRAQLKKVPEEVFLRGWLQGQAVRGGSSSENDEATTACREVLDLTAEVKLKEAEDIDSDSTTVPLEPAIEEEEGADAEAVSCVLQPFSSAPDAGEPCQRLVPPPRLASSLSPIVRCGCGKSSQHRSSHRKFAGGVQEHALLDAMSRQFTTEWASGASFLFLAACRTENQDLQWIVTDAESGSACSVQTDKGCADHVTGMVVGYTASQSGYKNTIQMNAPGLELAEWSSFTAPDEILLLQQLWVEPHFRRRGVATQALRSLLTGQQACAVQGPTQLVLEILDQLGFQVLGQQRCSSGRQVCLFGRRTSCRG
eukprot:TRINITY_DN8402_c0_g1_i3.p1 TRINITY_DN8402_c0_g1~~TRINITY_DN8402_c0_g1_i3.p1  ORF type:complete len:486 (-),score=88.36 TRINITY_DN8402_c0_g1_i3:144-1601(-)